MGDRFKKTQAGQPLDISAEVWNSFLDSVRARKGNNHDQLVDVLDRFREADIIKVRNTSAGDRSRFHVLGIDAPIIPPSANEREFKNQVATTGSLPQLTHFGRFVVLLDPLKQGKIGRAWVSGTCPVQIEIEDECHQFADIKENESAGLISRPHGSAQILWREGGLGVQWAVVRLSNVVDDVRRFKLTESLTRCGSAAVQRVVYQETPQGDPKWCELDCPFQVYDSLGVVCPGLCVSQGSSGQCTCGNKSSVPAGTFGWAKWLPDSQKWEVIQLGEGCCQEPSSSGSSVSGSSSSYYSSSSYSSSSSVSYSSGSSSSSDSSSGSSSSGSSSGSSSSGSSGSSSESSGSSGASGSSGDSSSSCPESCVTVYETDVRCEYGKLNVYTRAVSICLEGCNLRRYEGNWVFAHGAGCCDCQGDSSSSSGSSSYWSSSSSYHSSSSGPSSSIEPSVEPSSSSYSGSSSGPSSSGQPSSSLEPSSVEPSLEPSSSSTSGSGSSSSGSASSGSASVSEVVVPPF